MNEVIVLGIAPSRIQAGTRKGLSLEKVDAWMKAAGFPEYGFHNVIPYPCERPKWSLVDTHQLLYHANPREKIVALGNFVSGVCSRMGIEHFKMPHPSGRNRKLNDPEYEKSQVNALTEYLTCLKQPDITKTFAGISCSPRPSKKSAT
jgi:hypothetical protein